MQFAKRDLRDRLPIYVRERGDRDDHGAFEGPDFPQAGHLRCRRLRVTEIRPAFGKGHRRATPYIVDSGPLLSAALLGVANVARVRGHGITDEHYKKQEADESHG